MKYALKQCTVCGSEDLREIDRFCEEGNEFINYVCLSCGEYVTSKSQYLGELKVKELHQKRTQREAATVFGSTETKEPVSPVKTKPDAAELFKDVSGKIVRLSSSLDEANFSFGTGFIVSKDGFVVTNAHVVVNKVHASDNLAFNLNEDVVGDGSYFEGTPLSVVSVNIKRDLALLKFDKEGDYPFVTFAKSERVETGDTVYALGNSKGKGLSLTRGIVSDALRERGGLDYILTDAAVNGGNSGGPLVSEDGEVIGVIASAEKDAVGMNYAIPSKDVIKFIEGVSRDEETEINISIRE